MKGPSNNNSSGASRDFKCPCGKSYLSYAAIFTHIKIKHNGKAPGPIEKPNTKSKPRGRPPLTAKKEFREDQKSTEAKKQLESPLIPEKNHNYKYYEAFRQIFNHLKAIQFEEPLEKDLWQEVQIFSKFDSFVESKNKNNFSYVGVTIGIGLAQFLKEVSSETESWRFQQIFILFMLLLQYIIDENNDISVISEAPIEFLIEYMNPFINEYIQDETERLEIDELWIMEKENMTKIFLTFYNWLKWKNYTQFCITLIGLF